MKISVIVPVYNSEELLSRCIDSICNQTYKDIEVLIIDDGSTDNSGVIADTYCEKDPRIRVFHQENKGVSAARNIGIRESTGELIAFVDSDDYIRPDMYFRLMQAQQKYHVDIVTSNFIVEGNEVSNNLVPHKIYSNTEIRNQILPSFTYENVLGIMEFKNKLFVCELIKSHCLKFYERFDYQEDLMFMINVYAYANSLYYLPEAFYEYYPTGTGLYSSYRENAGKRFIEARQIMVSLIERYHIPNINWNSFNLAFLYNITFFIYRTLYAVKDKSKKKQLVFQTLKNEDVINCCIMLSHNATSFDKRIAKAIAVGNLRIAIILILFVYTGVAEKTQKLIGKIKR